MGCCARLGPAVTTEATAKAVSESDFNIMGAPLYNLASPARLLSDCSDTNWRKSPTACCASICALRLQIADRIGSANNTHLQQFASPHGPVNAAECPRILESSRARCLLSNVAPVHFVDAALQIDQRSRCDKMTVAHSITSSARASRAGGSAIQDFEDVMGITKRSILFRFEGTKSHHIATETTCRTEASWHHGHIRGRFWARGPLGAARPAVRRGQRGRRSRIQGGREASAHRR